MCLRGFTLWPYDWECLHCIVFNAELVLSSYCSYFIALLIILLLNVLKSLTVNQSQISDELICRLAMPESFQKRYLLLWWNEESGQNNRFASHWLIRFR